MFLTARHVLYVTPTSITTMPPVSTTQLVSTHHTDTPVDEDCLSQFGRSPVLQCDLHHVMVSELGSSHYPFTLPIPAAARYWAAGQPNPPAPTIRTDVNRTFSWADEAAPHHVITPATQLPTFHSPLRQYELPAVAFHLSCWQWREDWARHTWHVDRAWLNVTAYLTTPT